MTSEEVRTDPEIFLDFSDHAFLVEDDEVVFSLNGNVRPGDYNVSVADHGRRSNAIGEIVVAERFPDER